MANSSIKRRVNIPVTTLSKDQRFHHEYRYDFVSDKPRKIFHPVEVDNFTRTVAEILNENQEYFLSMISNEFNKKSTHKAAVDNLRRLDKCALFSNNIRIEISPWPETA